VELIEVGMKKKVLEKFAAVFMVVRNAGNGRCKDQAVEGALA
jgi:hypothetical protein